MGKKSRRPRLNNNNTGLEEAWSQNVVPAPRDRRLYQYFRDKTTEAVKAIAASDENWEHLSEYNEYIILTRLVEEGPKRAMKAVRRWPVFRPHWHRVRRRICHNCHSTVGLAMPRFLVCSGCGVARYCCEACQSAHWPKHQAKCQAAQVAQAQAKERRSQAMDEWLGRHKAGLSAESNT